MSDAGRLTAVDRGRRSALSASIGALWPVVPAVVGGAAFAYLVSSGRWYLALGLLLALPVFVLLHRHPMAAVTVWLLVTPLVAITDKGAVRQVFWLVHRGLPAATLAVLVLSWMAGVGTRRLARLGLPELMMVGYVVVTLISITYTASDARVSVYVLYDNVVIPMCLYLIVRLVTPDERDLKRLVPVAVFLLLSQALIGLLSWVAPGALPGEWLSKLGERTTGSLRSPDVFSVTMLFCGLFLLHAGLTARRSSGGRVWSILLFLLSVIMVFLTFSRASWLAGIVVVLGTLYAYRRFVKHLAVIVVPLAVLFMASGLLSQQLEFAQYRLDSEESEESALSRLPVVYAAWRMFEAKPIMGWGYENFDRFDYRFQRRVGDLVYPEKDHASHNLYLTTLAEQGMVGFVLLVGPAFVLLARTRKRFASLSARGFVGRKLVVALWLVAAGHVVVNNFSRMQVSVGLGMWWLGLGLIATIVGRYGTATDRPVADREGWRTDAVRGPRDLARTGGR